MNDRWSLPDLESTLAWCRDRAKNGIRGIAAELTEYSRTPEEAMRATERQIKEIQAIGARSRGTSFSVKPSSVGILQDPALYRENLAAIAHASREAGVPLEIDMEGRPLVEETLRSVLALIPKTGPVTVALQAYLDRTPGDLESCIRAGLRSRLVKGTYLGDTTNFILIQERFRALASSLIPAGIPFSAGTHDPELIAWLQDQTAGTPHLVEFSFLKGLSQHTMLGLAAEGRLVAEYVPYGPGGDSYRLRRQRYLEMLDQIGRSPAP